MKLISLLKVKFKNADFITNLIVLLMLLLAFQSMNAQCPTPPGNQTDYGNGYWRGYVYSGLDTNNPPQNTFTTTVYRGFVTQTEQFDQNLVDAPISGPNVCGSYADRFSVRYKMYKNWAPGYYTITVGGDDGVRLSIDSGNTWLISDWNYHAYQTTSATVYLAGDVFMVLENYDQGGQSQVSFNYTYCNSYSTAPTGISGTTAICNGTSTTLTATGGTLSSTGVYQWGTGNTVGNNTIAGQTAASITVSPNNTTIYWVRRIDPAPCNVQTAGVTQQVTVTNGSTAPTTLAGSTTLCLGSSATLTASGGTLAAGSVYEWGTGTVGSNIITGETGASITVTPTTTTTYWVRRTNPSPCLTTSAVTATVTVNVPPGDQVSYGTNSWIGYVYSTIGTANPPADAFTVPYRGYITETETFNHDWAVGGPSGANICGTYTDRFAVRFKMQKNFTPGYYTFTVGGDDGFRLSLDGGATFAVANWTDHGYGTTTSSVYYLSGSTNLVLEYYEQGGSAQVSFNYTACTDFSSAPTSITGNTTVCNNTNTTLTATGGYAAPGSYYQWGTGTTVGNNIIGGQTGASITVNPGTNSATYWVRRMDPAPCNLTTAGVTQLVTVVAPSTQPNNITGTNSICSGSSTTLTANGGTHGTGAVYQWGTGWVGNAIIAGETGASITVSPTSNTTYWVRRIDTAPCNTQTGGPTYNVTVTQISTAPTSINNAASVCSPNGGVTLNAIGGAGSNTFQWGTGTVAGANVVTGTNNNLYVNPTAVTTYWVRRYDAAPCNTYTSAATVTVYPASTAPTTITGTNLICNGQSSTLTASGGSLSVNGTYQWGFGGTGNNIIAGETGATITVSPTATTTYWVRRIDSAPCTTITNSAAFTVTVNQRSVAPTSISGPSSLCYTAGGGTLTAVGGTPGTNATYQWGTGTVGSNIQASTINTMYINPSVTTTYWVRLVDPAPCSATSAAVTFTVSVNTVSTNVTGISGTTTICNGQSTTLTATGGTLGIGAAYQWGTGTTLGSNIIAGQTGVSITVSPTTNTTYWVRRADGSPCTGTTWGPNTTVTVNTTSTAPTAVTGGTTVCPGTSVTLTATGGSGSATYQWGTGTAPSNIIAGQTGASITVSPTATTTYWVRRVDAAPCSLYTASASATVTMSSTGDPTVFGANQWNVYGYSTGDITLATAAYAGYYTQATLGFDTTASWSNLASPSSASNWSGCPVPADNFTFVHKRRGFPCGTYTVVLNNWDDATEVYINGNLVWSCATWSGGGCSGTVGTYSLNNTATIEVRTRENTGNANAALTLTNTTVASTAPTAISGTTLICSGNATTLTASGGTAGSNGVFQWGTGTVGSNIISGETGASITVSPAATTTYWVRRINSVCGYSTAHLTLQVTVGTTAIAGTLSSEKTVICRNSRPGSIFLSGHTGNVVKWQYANDAAFTNGVTDIAVTATVLSANDMGTFSATRYFRAVIQGCNTVYTAPIEIRVPATITYNGSWSGTPNENTPVIINSNLTLTSDLTVCACQVKNGVTMTVSSNSNLIVKSALEVEPTANLVIEDKGSLVQVDDSATDIGKIKMKRHSQPMKTYDYTYWSSPVQGNTLFQLSPQTLSDKYYSFSPMINNWVSIAGGAQTMEAGRGYIIRAPQGWSLTNGTSGVYQSEFNGVPNNGVVSATIQKGSGTSNLIGNPYPSAIDIDLFLTDPANANIVSGTIYLWTHNTAISGSISGNNLYNYTADDYAKYNLTGGVRSANPAITGGTVPDGKVAAGQGFFIEANGALANGTYSATFKNSMRVAGHNGTFYRNTAVTNPSQTAVSKNRLWLNVTNANGAYNEVLVGYVSGASNGFDNLYDGKIFPAGNVLTMYSISGSDQYAIQGRALPFDQNDVIPLGYKTTIAGSFTLSLAEFDGFFTGQDVYLVDHLLGATQNLKQGDYAFTSAVGTFNDRFEIKFTNSTLGTESANFKADQVLIVANDKQIGVRSSERIKSIAVFDLLGRKIYGIGKIDALQFRTPELLSAEQVLIVKVLLESGYEQTQKVILQ